MSLQICSELKGKKLIKLSLFFVQEIMKFKKYYDNKYSYSLKSK